MTRRGVGARRVVRCAYSLRVQRHPLKQKIPGLRFLAFVASSIVGSTVALAAPIATTALIFMVLDWLDLSPDAVAIVIALGFVATLVATMHLLGVLVTRAQKLRAPWGDLAIGRDGIAWEGWLGRRFVPWPTVLGMKRTAEELRLQWEGGTVKIGLDDPAVAHTAAAAAHAAADGPLEIPDALEAGDPAAWLAKVRGLTAGSYRDQVVSDETLLRVLEHPATPPLPRLGAALALAKREPAKVRVVIDDLADDEAKRALEAALTGEPELAAVKQLAKR